MSSSSSSSSGDAIDLSGEWEPTHINLKNGKRAELVGTDSGKTLVRYSALGGVLRSTSRFFPLQWYKVDDGTGRVVPCSIVGARGGVVRVQVYDSGREIGGEEMEVPPERLQKFENAVARRRIKAKQDKEYEECLKKDQEKDREAEATAKATAKGKRKREEEEEPEPLTLQELRAKRDAYFTARFAKQAKVENTAA